MGSACFARGNDKNAEIIEKYIKDNNLDATIELYGARCENNCEKGPNIYVDGKCITCSDNDVLKKILENIK